MASGCFDLLAAEYDRAWTNSGPGRLQRNAVWRQILPLFQAGQSVLDLGCGTGEDARALSHRGVRVSALDASPEMVRIARHRGVDAHVGAIEAIDTIDGRFDGVISNFGALNCISRLAPLRAPLARLVRPGGYLAVCLMSRFCAIETLHFLRQFRFGKAARRWPGETFSETLKLKAYYPRAAQVRQAMTPEFDLRFRTGIGFTVPPSYVNGIGPASLHLRSRIDEWFAHLPLLRAMSDHQLYIFRRR